MTFIQSIENNIFSVCSAILVIPLIASVIINIVFFAYMNLYMLSYLNLITDVIITMILGVLSFNPKQPLIYVKYYFILSFINCVGTVLSVIEITETVNSILKIISLWSLIIGYLKEIRTKGNVDRTEKQIVTLIIIFIAGVLISVDIGVLYYAVKKATDDLNTTIAWSVVCSITTSCVLILNFQTGLNYDGYYEQASIIPMHGSYIFYIIATYVIMRFHNFMTDTFILPIFQCFIWVHYIVIAITIIVVNIKYEDIIRKDFLEKQKEAIELQKNLRKKKENKELPV